MPISPLPVWRSPNSADEQYRLLTACKRSRSRSLCPAFLLSLHTGLRNRDLRHLRWHQVNLIQRTVTVGISKTKGGEGRLVPLSNMAFESLQDWRSKFLDAQPSHYVFPRERYGLKGEDGHKTGTVAAYDIDPPNRSVPGRWLGRRLARWRKSSVGGMTVDIRSSRR